MKVYLENLFKLNGGESHDEIIDCSTRRHGPHWCELGGWF
ncbi:protein of unknown function [Tepidibacter aestuarii]|nr:protein of unknown function [Tepidibacter aestuarii]